MLECLEYHLDLFHIAQERKTMITESIDLAISTTRGGPCR